MIIGVDPGDTTGVCEVEVQHHNELDVDFPAVKSVNHFTHKEFNLWALNRFAAGGIETVVCEDYILFGHKAQQQSGSRFVAVQIIGTLKLLCEQYEIPLILQRSDILSIAQKWSKMMMPSNHAQSHWVSAYNHVFYRLVLEKRIKPNVAPGTRQTDTGPTEHHSDLHKS